MSFGSSVCVWDLLVTEHLTFACDGVPTADVALPGSLVVGRGNSDDEAILMVYMFTLEYGQLCVALLVAILTDRALLLRVKIDVKLAQELGPDSFQLLCFRSRQVSFDLVGILTISLL